MDSPGYYLFDLFASYSFDGGQTFTTNHRISTVSSSPGDLKLTPVKIPILTNEDGTITPLRLEPRAGLIGEYIGVTAFHDKINAVWTDSRDGNSEVYTANWYLPLLEPKLQQPLDGIIIGTDQEFQWSTSWKHNQDRYRLEISDNETFDSILVSQVLDSNRCEPAGSLAYGHYFWKVKALNNQETDSSAYSIPRTFVVGGIPFAEAGGPYSGDPDEQITFNASGSYDLDGTIDQYA